LPGFNVIDEVSQSLVAMLKAELQALTSTVETHDLQGPIQNDLRLTLFLFEVGEDPSARNRPRVREAISPDVRIAKPPMALLLRYLITPWGGTESTRHRLLGGAMQALYDHSILSFQYQAANGSIEQQELKITLSPLSIEERTRVWYSVQKPYRLSVSYEVRVVNMDSQVFERVRPVRERVLDSALPEFTE